MPEDKFVTVNSHGDQAKKRHPWGAFAISIVTLGIYALYWFLVTNKELRSYYRRWPETDPQHVQVRPVWRLIALVPGGFLIVPPFIAFGLFARDVKQVGQQRQASEPLDLLTYWIIVVVSWFTLPFWVPYVQGKLNQTWESIEQENRSEIAT